MAFWQSESWLVFRGHLLWALNAVLALAGLGALGCLVADLGWHLAPEDRTFISAITRWLLVVFVVQEFARTLLFLVERRFGEIRRLELALAGLAAMELFFAGSLRELAPRVLPGLDGEWVALSLLAVTQLTVLLAAVVRGFRASAGLTFKQVAPPWVLIGSFAGLILLGTLLLLMPSATAAGISPVDAFFTSVSAVCVTGLTVVDTRTAFTPLGHVILLVLIQLGGLGIMTLTYFFAVLLGGRMSIRGQVLLQELLSEESLGRISTVLLWIVGLTLGIEAFGAVALYLSSRLGPAAEASWFDCVFHSVSAFCNAGFSTFTNSLMVSPWRDAFGPQLVIACLIILGGLGFPVFVFVGQHVRWRWRRRRCRPPKFGMHARLVIETSLLLTLGGTAALFLVEYLDPARPHAVSGMFTAFFHAVSARTAGFNTVPMEGLGTAAVLILILLMYVGGSPGGTAGGVRTTTFALAVMNLWRLLREREAIEYARRRVGNETARRCFAIVILSLGWIAGTHLTLVLLEPKLDVVRLLFETVSAFSTVGLTMDVTARLSDPSKVLIALTMFIGRIGLITFALALIPKAKPARQVLPEDRVLLS